MSTGNNPISIFYYNTNRNFIKFFIKLCLFVCAHHIVFVIFHIYGFFKVENTGRYANRRRHGDKLNMFFADGHIESMTGNMLRLKSQPNYYSSEMFGNKGYK